MPLSVWGQQHLCLGEERAVLGNNSKPKKKEQGKKWSSWSEDWHSVVMLKIKREEKHLLGLKAVSAFLQTSKMLWIQVCGMISHARESEVTFGLNLHQLLRDLWKHSGKYANVAFPIQYKECCHGSQGMKFPLEHYHSLERCCSVAYGWRWVIFLVSSILTIKHIMRERERGIEFSLCYQSFNTCEQNRWVN